MMLQVAELKRRTGSQRKTRWQEPIENFDLKDTDFKLLAPIQAKVQVTNVGDRMLVEGEAVAKLLTTCCRCLIEFEQELIIDLEETFLFVSKVFSEEEGDEENEDRYLPVLMADQIDLTELLKESFFSQLPIKAVCKEECLGLCETCGKDLNEGPCDCQEEAVDPRFAILSQWKKKE
ncbi:MAG: DUF177 domain-containing protein [Firmicutes bacterium]|nr:DUF177 domain-containing protein [Bacillota bacterium]